MRELLLAFVFALIVGSIINGMQQKPNMPAPAGAVQNNSSLSTGDGSTNTSKDANSSQLAESATETSESHRDFPDFTAFANLDNANFDDMVLKSQKPVFVSCYVPNNQACDQMIPLIAAVAKSHENSILMARLNVMDNILLAHRYEVGSVPTFLLFDHGTLMGKLTGVLSQDRLESLIANLAHGEH
jgi:thioredoxin 1